MGGVPFVPPDIAARLARRVAGTRSLSAGSHTPPIFNRVPGSKEREKDTERMASVGLSCGSNLSLLSISKKPSLSSYRASAVSVKNAMSAAEENKGFLSIQKPQEFLSAAKVPI